MSVVHQRSPLLGYRPELDGLRALAVLAVMAAHSGVQRGNGFLGVEIFFVLSGYLITTLLVREHAQSGGIDFRLFYAKRVLRLFPALLALVGAMAVYTFIFAPDDLRDSLTTGLWSSAVYVSNWVRASGTSLAFLNHTWSLAIEEQFYLVWPPVLGWSLIRGWSLRWISSALIVIIVLVGIWRRVLHIGGADYERLYNGLDTRLDALMCGALLAVVLSEWVTGVSSPMRRAAHGVGWIAAAILAIGLLVDADGTVITIADGFSISALLCVCVVMLVVVEPAPWLRRALSLQPLVWIGVRSYGLYLWHFPIFKILEDVEDTIGTQAYGVLSWAVAFAVAAISYRIIETPFLRWKNRIVSNRRLTPRVNAAP